ncbi:hypothetical protein RI030_08800 [Aphanizomenon flos-aquae NRERC-008]|jgi:hypothetical protein|uniref:Gas vesicle protein n=3 Tax=Aphanizomenon flos-aquae TaxID=1176 RepID=A0A1B7WZN4_APHFL|nr:MULTISPECIES: hypothetical protein [Aphanizomenon]MBD1219472.1 hypothetical protein [Aphanizomenon flos-aquae Clear-A1]MBO1045767.1 hypothetical protein [Aphanizomenon flos-aquae UKL13-PB]MBO1060633.1 hypothetical protein [Aphanizomenon flos-aquae CP01]MCE2905947.1 hypothetical protein [Anabaena sp. CoA2_C59]MDJ0505013.1 hypothetical protein [Nostocales cyanobacterium LE14-WE12]NTW18584.1 hypothetical protein [Nostocales cyanobacterium W4_Combined_metabat2_030]OBQ20078.1 MAG: hypothetical
MSQQDGFASGLLLGTLIGGVVGGVLGAVITSRLDAKLTDEENEILTAGEKGQDTAARRRQMRASANESLEIEATRRSLEDKIAQLNATIDDVRQQLGNVNSNSSLSNE